MSRTLVIDGNLILQASSTLTSVFVGASAGNNSFTGSQNVGVGQLSLTSLTTGTQNTAVGYNAGHSVATNGSAAAFGYDAMQNHTGNQNTAIGALTLNGSGSGSINTALGYQAGNSDTSGGKNILLGWNAASTTASGSNNIALGYDIALPSTNGSNQLNIGNLIFGTGINGEGTNLSTGSIGIGTTSPPFKLTVDNAGSSGIVAGFENSSGECTINPTGSSVNCSSDITLKKNITSISTSTALASILALDPVFFNWNAEATGSPQHSGFIAQAVLPIFPDLVSTGSNGKLLLNYAGFTPYLAAAMKEIAAVSGAFKANLIAWLGDAQNGIMDLFAKNIYATNIAADHGSFNTLSASSTVSDSATFKELCAQKSDGTSVCVTGDQLSALLSGSVLGASAQ